MLPKAVLLNITINAEAVTNINPETILDELFGIVPGYSLSCNTICNGSFASRERSSIDLLPFVINAVGVFGGYRIETQVIGFFCFPLKYFLYFDMLVTSGCIVAVLLWEL